MLVTNELVLMILNTYRLFKRCLKTNCTIHNVLSTKPNQIKVSFGKQVIFLYKFQVDYVVIMIHIMSSYDNENEVLVVSG